MLEVDFEVRGLRELEDELADLDRKTGTRVIRSSLMAATLPMLKRARELAPVDPLDKDGHIRDALGRRTKVREDSSVVMRLGERNKAPKLTPQYKIHGPMLEFGTRYMAARPFLRPAFDSSVEQVLRLFSKSFGKNLRKAQRR